MNRQLVRRVWHLGVHVAPAALLVAAGVLCSIDDGPRPWAGHVATQPFETRMLDSSNPLSGEKFYVDWATSAAVAATATPSSAELRQIADTPQVLWMGDDLRTDAVANAVRVYVEAAASQGAMPLLATYALPHRDCGNFSNGGFATGDDYRDWIDQVAAGIGTARVAIVLEPDGLTAADCLPGPARRERFELLRDAVASLTTNPNTAVYVDGGHSRWLSPDELARRLADVGVERARGFALNTSNFFATQEEIGYGEQVSSLTGGAHYVVDTSRNGAGPAPDGPMNWCNPQGRAIGTVPTTQTKGVHADAYLWIKHPGESDGECGRGDPKSGLFMPQYAIDLVRRASG
jgi:endoglucanase